MGGPVLAATHPEARAVFFHGGARFAVAAVVLVLAVGFRVWRARNRR